MADPVTISAAILTAEEAAAAASAAAAAGEIGAGAAAAGGLGAAGAGAIGAGMGATSSMTPEMLAAIQMADQVGAGSSYAAGSQFGTGSMVHGLPGPLAQGMEGLSKAGQAFGKLPSGIQGQAMQGLLGGGQQAPVPQAAGRPQRPQEPPPQRQPMYGQQNVQAGQITGLLGMTEEQRRRLMMGMR